MVNSNKKFQSGFTLMEMVIACGIVAVLSTSVYLIFINGNRLFTLQNNLAIAENQALKSSLIMQRELREARAPEGLNLQAIEEATSQSIIFYADISDEPVNNREEKIQYLLHNGYLLRGVAYWNNDSQSYNALPDLTQYNPGGSNPGMQVMAQYVVNGANPIFYYFDQDYSGSQDPLGYPINLGSVKVIKTILEIDVNSRPPEPYIHETTIQLRNPNL